MPAVLRVLTIVSLWSLLTVPLARGGEVSPTITVGTQEVGLTAGYIFSHRLTELHTTKQHGPALMPSWMMTLTDPIGDSWHRGQFSIGAEMVYLQFREPVLTHGVGFTPRIKYTFVALGRLRPYAEFTGGPFWTDLGGNIDEQANEFQRRIKSDTRLPGGGPDAALSLLALADESCRLHIPRFKRKNELLAVCVADLRSQPAHLLGHQLTQNLLGEGGASRVVLLRINKGQSCSDTIGKHQTVPGCAIMILVVGNPW